MSRWRSWCYGGGRDTNGAAADIGCCKCARKRRHGGKKSNAPLPLPSASSSSSTAAMMVRARVITAPPSVQALTFAVASGDGNRPTSPSPLSASPPASPVPDPPRSLLTAPETDEAGRYILTSLSSSRPREDTRAAPTDSRSGSGDRASGFTAPATPNALASPSDESKTLLGRQKRRNVIKCASRDDDDVGCRSTEGASKSAPSREAGRDTCEEAIGVSRMSSHPQRFRFDATEDVEGKRRSIPTYDDVSHFDARAHSLVRMDSSAFEVHIQQPHLQRRFSVGLSRFSQSSQPAQSLTGREWRSRPTLGNASGTGGAGGTKHGRQVSCYTAREDARSSASSSDSECGTPFSFLRRDPGPVPRPPTIVALSPVRLPSPLHLTSTESRGRPPPLTHVSRSRAMTDARTSQTSSPPDPPTRARSSWIIVSSDDDSPELDELHDDWA